MHMNYEKLSGSIRAVIDRRPGDVGAYSDLFSLCREWETENFSAAHKANKELLALSADQVVRGGGAKFYEQWRRCLLFEAPHDFDSFMTYIELDRKPEKRFYAPRKHYLRPMVQGFQDVLDGKLRLLTISMPKRAGKSQTGINFVNMISGKFPDRSTLMEGTGDDLVKSFYNGCLEYLTVPNEYLFYDVFPDARLVQTNADTKTVNLKSKSRFPTIMCRSIDARQVGLSEATNVLYLDDCVEGREEAKNRQRLDDKWEVISGDIMGRAIEGTPMVFTGTRYSLYDPITNDTMCAALADQVKKYLQMRNTYQTKYRGNPELEVGDVIGLQTLYTDEMDALILVDEITFNGSLSGKLKVKGLI